MNSTVKHCMAVMRYVVLLAFLAAANAVPPPNDAFASRIIVTGASYSITTSNVDATRQTGENSLFNTLGATIWWQWTAPSSGWVRFDTWGSAIDTVMRVSRTTGVNGTQFGYNDDDGFVSGESALTFQATAGQILYISVGGYMGDLGAEEGEVVFNITTGVNAQPSAWISAASFSPASVNVTNSAQSSVFSVTMAGTAGARGTIADLEFLKNGSTVVFDTVVGQDYVVGTRAATRTIQVPRYVAGGVLQPLIGMETEDGEYFQWGNAFSGMPYLYATPPTLTVQNTGEFDSLPPVLSAFSISGTSINVNRGAITLNVSMTLTDALSGVDYVYASLSHPNGFLERVIPLARTSGSITNGTWMGSVIVPQEFPSAEYSVYVELGDAARNNTEYGYYGTNSMPGGDVFVNVSGGGAYWLWAYQQIDDDAQVGMQLDPNGDGLNNLTCFAFGLEPVLEEPRIDLPVISVQTSGKLGMEYYRRVDAVGMTYKAQFSNDLTQWSDFAGVETVEATFEGWNLMKLEDTQAAIGGQRRFARMKLTYVDP